jgi:hypothetical protein
MFVDLIIRSVARVSFASDILSPERTNKAPGPVHAKYVREYVKVQRVQRVICFDYSIEHRP